MVGNEHGCNSAQEMGSLEWHVHSILPLQGRMEWKSIPFCPWRAIWHVGKNGMLHRESPEISPGLNCEERPFSEYKIDHIYKTMVLSVGTWSNLWGRPYLVIMQLKL